MRLTEVRVVRIGKDGGWQVTEDGVVVTGVYVHAASAFKNALERATRHVAVRSLKRGLKAEPILVQGPLGAFIIGAAQYPQKEG